MSEKIFAIYILFFAVGLACAEFDYCKKLGKNHTMCKYKEKSGCKKVTSGLSKDVKKKILKEHNKIRQRVANGKQKGHPTAANMKEMIWDDQLAAVAQRWADQCIFDHDQKRTTERFNESAGQNLGLNGFSGKAASESNFSDIAVRKMWFGEAKKFDPKDIKKFKSSDADHYTEIIWADTYAIGCGYAYYKKKKGYTKLYVCNYGPSGNVGDGKIYKTGKPCSKCKACSKDYPGLCKTKGNKLL